MDGSFGLCYYRSTEGTAVVVGNWRLALLVGVVAVAMADEQYVIWRSSAVSGFDWEPTSGVYYSKEDCDQAIEARRRRIARALTFLRRIGADAAVQSAVGDRVYECRPTVTSSPPDRLKAPESP